MVEYFVRSSSDFDSVSNVMMEIEGFLDQESSGHLEGHVSLRIM